MVRRIQSPESLPCPSGRGREGEKAAGDSRPARRAGPKHAIFSGIPGFLALGISLLNPS